jgi:uncharacterized protein (TIGR04222 family)
MFDLNGPQFLALYVALASVVLIGLHVRRRIRRTGADGDERTFAYAADPYRLAYLCYGAAHALRLATISLVDRGVLQAEEHDLRTVVDRRDRDALHPIETKIASYFVGGKQPANSVLKLHAAARELFEPPLVAAGLLPDAAARSQEKLVAIAATAGLAGVAGARVLVSVARGHQNVEFLIALALLAAWLAWRSIPRLTPKGEHVVTDLRALLKQSHPMEEGREQPQLLAAIFGIAAYPIVDKAVQDALFGKAVASGSGACGSCGGCGGCGCGGCG